MTTTVHVAQPIKLRACDAMFQTTFSRCDIREVVQAHPVAPLHIVDAPGVLQVEVFHGTGKPGAVLLRLRPKPPPTVRVSMHYVRQAQAQVSYDRSSKHPFVRQIPESPATQRVQQ